MGRNFSRVQGSKALPGPGLELVALYCSSKRNRGPRTAKRGRFREQTREGVEPRRGAPTGL